MPSLYIIATPIGNLEDITLRAVRTLREVSAVLAEDTRVAAKLLQHYEIKVPVITWHQHSSGATWTKVRGMLEDGKDLACITDAGTPGISDPGGKLIDLVLHEVPGTSIIPIPGPSALTAAISIAGIPLDEFTFLGFLPHKKGRQTMLKQIGASRCPVILFESVHRINKLLIELQPLEKQLIICRELTKVHETVYRGSAAQIMQQLKPAQTKGEFVVIIHSHEST